MTSAKKRKLLLNGKSTINFPSSEDLSAFLPDLELDALNKRKEKSQAIINSKMSSRPKPCVTSEEKTPGEMVTRVTNC